MPATDFDVIENALHTWVVACTGLAGASVQYGQLAQVRPAGAWVSMLIMGIVPVGSDWMDVEDNLHTFADLTLTADNTTDVFTAVAHGRLSGDGPVRLETTGTVPTGLELNHDYWVIRLTNDTFQLADKFRDSAPPLSGATAIPVLFSTNGTGVLTLVDTPTTVRAGSEVKDVVRGTRSVTMSIQAHAGQDPVTRLPVGSPKTVLNDLVTACSLPTKAAILQGANIGLAGFDGINTTGEKMNTTFFEPRAVTMCKLNITAEISEIHTFIQRVSGKNQIYSPEVDFLADAEQPPP